MFVHVLLNAIKETMLPTIKMSSIVHSFARYMSPVAKPFQLRGVVHSGWLAMLFVFCSLALMVPHQVEAITCTFTIDPDPPISKGTKLTFTFNSLDIADSLNRFASGGELQFYFPETKKLFGNTCRPTFAGATVTEKNKDSFNTIPLSVSVDWNIWDGDTGGCRPLFKPDTDHRVELRYSNDPDHTALCAAHYRIPSQPPTCKVTYDFSHSNPPNITDGTVDDIGWKIVVSNISNTDRSDPRVYVKVDEVWLDFQLIGAPGGAYDFPLPPELRTVDPNPHIATAYIGNDLSYTPCDAREFSIVGTGETNICADRSRQKQGFCAGDYKKCSWCSQNTPPERFELIELCDQLPQNGSSNFPAKCRACADKSDENSQYIWTAIGCLPTDFTTILNDYIFTYGTGIAGGIAFLRFVYGCFLVMTCGGNAETLEESKAIIMSALAGLFLIIFSVFFLVTIGVNIFEIPGWKR